MSKTRRMCRLDDAAESHPLDTHESTETPKMGDRERIEEGALCV